MAGRAVEERARGGAGIKGLGPRSAPHMRVRVCVCGEALPVPLSVPPMPQRWQRSTVGPSQKAMRVYRVSRGHPLLVCMCSTDVKIDFDHIHEIRP